MKRCLLIAALTAASVFLNGCGIIMFGAVVTTAAVTGTGYVVYKTGEAVVVTTEKAAGSVIKAGGKAVSKTGDATGKAAGSVQEIVFLKNEMKASCHADVRRTHDAATAALLSLGFTGVHGRADAASGRLNAVTVENQEIEIALKYADAQRTSIRIRVGTRGDMKTSELIYNQILSNLSSAPVES